MGILVAALGGLYATSGGFVLLDTYELLDGTGVMADCLRAAVFTECGPQVNEFALLQYLPALLYHEAGLSYDAAIRGLLALSAASALGIVLLVRLVLLHLAGPVIARVAVLLVLVSPILWYSNSSYGEALAALAVTIATAVLLLRAHPVILVTAIAVAGVSKETAPIFLALIALTAWRIQPDAGPRRRTELFAVGIGTVLAVAVNSLFNVFRYGSVTNLDYLRPALDVPLGEIPISVAALVAAPSGGLIWMWPLGLVVLGTAVAVELRRRSVARFVRSPAFAILALWVALLANLGTWYSPFGGTSWGPRLLVPWLPALVLLPLAAYGRAVETLVQRILARPARVAATVMILVIVGLPQAIATVDSTRYARAWPGTGGDRRELAVRPYGQDRECPVFPIVEQDAAYYWRCLHHSLWEKGLLVQQAYSKLDSSVIAVYAGLYAAVVAALAATCARRYEPARA